MAVYTDPKLPEKLREINQMDTGRVEYAPDYKSDPMKQVAVMSERLRIADEHQRLERAVLEAAKELRKYKSFSMAQVEVIDRLYAAIDALLQFEQEHSK